MYVLNDSAKQFRSIASALDVAQGVEVGVVHGHTVGLTFMQETFRREFFSYDRLLN